MSAKKRFFWLGVIDAVNYRPMKKISDWPKWQALAYFDGHWAGRNQIKKIKGDV